MDHKQIDQRIQGLTEKFSIKGQTSKADALEEYLVRIRRLARSLGGGDSARTIVATSQIDQDEAAQNVISSLLMTMLELSETPTMQKRGETTRYTIPDALKETSKDGTRTQEQINRDMWRAILAEDPLVGDHWQSQNSLDSIGQASDDSDFEDMEVAQKPANDSRGGGRVPSTVNDGEDQNRLNNNNPEIGSWISNLDLWTAGTNNHSLVDSAQIMALRKQQYFHGDSVLSKTTTSEVPIRQEKPYDIQSSTGLNAAVQENAEFQLTGKVPVMDEVDIIHEVLMLLQGLPSIIFTLDNKGVSKVISTRANAFCNFVHFL